MTPSNPPSRQNGSESRQFRIQLEPSNAGLGTREMLAILSDIKPPGQNPGPLEAGERALLARCERTVAKGLAGAFRAGLALSLVRELRLYRETHGSFEAYAKDLAQVGRAQAYRLMEYAGVCASLQPLCKQSNQLPNQRQARPLMPLADEERRQVWRRAVASYPRLTESAIRQLASKMFPQGGCVEPKGEGEEQLRLSLTLSGHVLDRVRVACGKWGANPKGVVEMILGDWAAGQNSSPTQQ